MYSCVGELSVAVRSLAVTQANQDISRIYEIAKRSICAAQGIIAYSLQRGHVPLLHVVLACLGPANLRACRNMAISWLHPSTSRRFVPVRGRHARTKRNTAKFIGQALDHLSWFSSAALDFRDEDDAEL